MSVRFKTFPELKDAQALAADPQAHAALSASAGTGKTQVLTARVLRLLLQGVRPESILCLTFTKAAAAEMANRIGARLAKWVRLKRADLWADLQALGERPDPPLLERARQLFAEVLDCPGGLKIQTIHAFAQGLLAAFPAEADVVPGFEPIEGRAEQELIRRTLADLLADAAAAGDEGLIADVQLLSRRLSEQGAVDYLQTCARRHEALGQLAPGPAISSDVRRLLGLPDGDIEHVVIAGCTDGAFDRSLFQRLIAANRAWGSGVKATTIVDNLEGWLRASPEERARRLEELGECIVKKDGEICQPATKQLASEPNYVELAIRFGDWLKGLVGLRSKARLADDMAAGLRAGQAFAAAYTRAKRAAGVADFNDLIEWTCKLLAKPGMGDWVRFKLDRQIDHILVDEAQDTNAAQWDIIYRLVEEYFSGSSESEQRHRTLFMVGDVKQAIYGFQGSEPARFIKARNDFQARADELAAAGGDSVEDLKRRALEFRDLSIGASFRSAQPVLDAVDSIIDTVGHEAMALAEPPPRHVAHHQRRPGRVELWQPFKIDDSGDDSDEGEERWASIRDRGYAQALAGRIAAMVEQAPRLASTGRPLTPGDMLVLVRSRGELASLIVGRLFAAGVPVAGVDRLHLHEPLAVQDLLAAVRFAVQPNDDLSLACLLVSPLFGWDHDQLRTLAFGRAGSLWRELQRRSEEATHHAAAFVELSEILRIADFTPPSRFLERILSGPLQGRRKLYGRLGLAARDPIDELMNSAIEFERMETPSLDRFLDWFARGTVDVQRDPGAPANEVRVMTVHGAKGLEAPVVIVADSTGDPAKLGRTPLSIDAEIDGHKVPLLRPRKEERCPPFDEWIVEEEKRDLEEHWRLLYVAATRAADRLIVSGVRPKEKKDASDPRPANCWHRVVEQALVSLGADAGQGHVALRYGSGEVAGGRAARVRATVPAATVPDWGLKPAPPESRPPRPLAPSAIGEDRDSAPPASEAMRRAARRGTLIHQLLERLPDVAPDARTDAALRWLERSGGVAAADEREELAGLVCGLLSDSRFGHLFGPGSLAEAPIAATLADGRVIAGTVDRLLVEQARVAVIDYKTGRVPQSADQVPPYHRVQMEAYVEALKAIFPDRDVTASLLYTAGPQLIQISG